MLKHVPSSVELVLLRACRPIPGPADPTKPAAPAAADSYRMGGGSRDSQASRAETSGYPPGRRYPGTGLRLAVCRDPVRAAAVLTAGLTGGAVSVAMSVAWWLARLG